jgi:pre-mRNA-processing factor SLU7
MVDMGAQADLAAALVAEDNFMRASGDAAEFERAQRYAWESQERGDKNKTHLQANPTSGEYVRRKEKEEREKKRETQRKLLLERYGGEKHLQPPLLRDTMVVENELYVEYDDSGAIKGAPKTDGKSKYAEDVLINNHTSVWGSWWANFQWGYACCHSTVKNSYCTGEEGKIAFAEADKRRTGGELESLSSIQDVEGNPGGILDVQNVEGRESLEKAEAERNVQSGRKKRNITEMKGGVTEEELEDYKRSKALADDPMAKFLGKDELVH